MGRRRAGERTGPMLMRKNQIMVGARVIFYRAVGVSVNDDREGDATGGVSETPVVYVAEGTTGTVVSESDALVCVALDEGFRATCPIDEVKWGKSGRVTARTLAQHQLEFVEQSACPECGSHALNSDFKHSVWVIYCACGMTVLEEDFSEETLERFKADLEADADILTEIQSILGDGAGDWCGCYDGDMNDTFEDKAKVASVRLLALVDRLRAKSEGVA